MNLFAIMPEAASPAQIARTHALMDDRPEVQILLRRRDDLQELDAMVASVRAALDSFLHQLRDVGGEDQIEAIRGVQDALAELKSLHIRRDKIYEHCSDILTSLRREATAMNTTMEKSAGRIANLIADARKHMDKMGVAQQKLQGDPIIQRAMERMRQLDDVALLAQSQEVDEPYVVPDVEA